MPNIKAFDINQWIQVVIGTLLLAAIFGLLKMAGDVQTLNIERKQDSQAILEIKIKTNQMFDKINELNQDVALAKQAIKMLAKTKGMEGVTNFDRPQLIDPKFERHAMTYQSQVNSDCDGKDCLPPVFAPQPQPAPGTNPTKQ